MLCLKELQIYFTIKNIEDLDSISVSNSFYFFKYFFGRIGFFLNYSYYFSLNIGYHSFVLQCNFFKNDIYFPLYFFINDVYFKLLNTNKGVSKKVINNNLEIVVHDMHFFTEKKTSVGFFNLVHKVTLKLISRGKNLNNNLFSLFKI